MSLESGNADCTTGLSKRLFDTWRVEPGAGLSPTLTAEQSAGMKSMCFAFAKAIVAEIQENSRLFLNNVEQANYRIK